ncbi:phospholipase C [Acetobacter nitrogenifigens DSM 23921 = NBRC 105050]|uniref:phospholipase C n=1 Tax=Acetobacter nitrogenifigens DSM 23921 = NBRC 105050 TaxID=1120919 RepID=A0A511XBB0_9PROT|nr:phospholipase C, phosphocholine-specific [Acetobacter nitrogenifigens]GBQ90769.1 phospholipase C [Acetobacter nitrogenifigens DSM 23921 = NBRC 105050]GEN60258.1 non-hemolytic phospholipase C [Acetobacter nitrogenifigens DSM 23921 = NBRC 105050]
MASQLERRALLGMGAGFSLTSLLPSIRRAQAIPARRDSGTIEDVQHIVVLMQENRSFDHYLGHLNGVRGYGDRHVVRGPKGLPIWWQQRHKAEDGWITPFHLPTQTTSAQCMIDLDHNWAPTHAAINKGWNDQWPRHKKDMTMGYYTREDIPFHYALADAFTTCDNWFCSTPTQTHPNRYYLMTGMVDPTGAGGGPVLDNVDWVDRPFYPHVAPPFSWTTYPERLQEAGIDWRIYQQGTSVSDVENGNFGTNVLMCFENYVKAQPGSPLYERAMVARPLDQLRADVLADRLPQVSWILPPAAYSEHPRWTPGYGATFIAHALDALTANPEVWARTAFLIMYDENDGYFDHLPPPQPPTPVLPGKSTIATTGEIHDRISSYEPERYTADLLPYGLGPRVPAFAISPWSTGGFVCSEVFDHTSVIRFIEARFGVSEPNITPWRRAICGDLTGAFDFSRKRHVKTPLPDTNVYKKIADAQCKLPNPVIPQQSRIEDIGSVEPGARPARALPYALAADFTASSSGAVTIAMRNDGARAACLLVYRDLTQETPRRYTIEAGKSLQDEWAPDQATERHFTVFGPNGFARYLRLAGPSTISLSTRHDAAKGALVLEIANSASTPKQLTLRDNAYGAVDRNLAVPAMGKMTQTLDLEDSHHWYDLAVTVSDETGNEIRVAGHVETGRASITDPAMGVGSAR